MNGKYGVASVCRLSLASAALVVAILVGPRPSQNAALACVVGNGTAGSCTETALDACLPGGATFDGTVTFSCGSAPAGITLNSRKAIGAVTDIDGGGLISLDGGENNGLFSVEPDHDVTVCAPNLGCHVVHVFSSLSLSNLNINHAFGSAVQNYGGLTVTNCTFEVNRTDCVGCTGSAIYNMGALTIVNSTFDNNAALTGSGGAIENFGGGSLTVTNSTFTNNQADYSDCGFEIPVHSGNGGAIDNSGAAESGRIPSIVTVSNSTFTNNVTCNGNGGAVANDGDTLTVSASTFQGNSSFGGQGVALAGQDIYSSGGLTVSNSTFNPNCAGAAAVSADAGMIVNCTFDRFVFEGGCAGQHIEARAAATTLTLSNTIVNTYANGHPVNCSGVISDGGHNIDSGTTCGFTGGGCSNTTGTSFCNTDPQLDSYGLAANGGPTQTIALQPNSPAINAGDESICSSQLVNNLDQRGFLRPGHGDPNCCIGAYEFDTGPPCGSPPIVCGLDQSCTNGQCVGGCPAGQFCTPTLPPSPTPTATPTPIACVGDCNSDHKVTVDELVKGVNIALGTLALDQCPPFNCNGTGRVTVDCLVKAVNDALDGCP